MLGIDQLNFYTSNYSIDVKELAKKHFLNEKKYLQDLGQQYIAVIPPYEDIVTLAANAALPLFKKDPLLKEQIGLVIFATETSFDTSKSASSYLHSFFNLPNNCRIIEMKQACYAATFGLFTGLQWLMSRPQKKVLLVAADIAKYPLNSKAELTQGGGGIAMILSTEPGICSVDLNSGVYTKEILDFWHPHYLPYALVDGRLSCNAYLQLLKGAWKNYCENNSLNFLDHQAFCFHTPVYKLVKFGYQQLLKINNINENYFETQVAPGLIYNQQIGNCYTVSLYLSLLSYLSNNSSLEPGNRIGCYSYGSGSTGEFFNIVLAKNYQANLNSLNSWLIRRQTIDYDTYCSFYFDSERLFSGKTLDNFDYPIKTGHYYLQTITDHKRIYAQKS